jgi:hypothetical protein
MSATWRLLPRIYAMMFWPPRDAGNPTARWTPSGSPSVVAVATLEGTEKLHHVTATFRQTPKPTEGHRNDCEDVSTP